MGTWWQALKERVVGREPPRLPLFLRVRGPDGRPVPWVDLEARFFPGNEYVRGKRHADAAGTCLLHWPKTALGVSLRLEHQQSVGTAYVLVERPDPTRVVIVSLAAP